MAVVPSGGHHFRRVAFSPDGRLLATVDGRSVQFWDTGAWTMKESLNAGGGYGHLTNVAFAPDGYTAAAATSTGRILLFDVPV